MNRQERRRMFALGVHAAETGEFPEEYIHVINAIVATLRVALRLIPNEKPRFAMPPRDVLVIVSLDAIAPKIARNDSAALILKGLIDGAVASGKPKDMPTLFMFSVALEQMGDAVDVEEATLAELGISMGQGCN